MRRVTAVLAAASAAALMAATGIGTASASANGNGAVIKVRGITGYFASLSTGGNSLTTSAQVTVPRLSCGAGAPSFLFPEVSALVVSGDAETSVSAGLTLSCFGPSTVFEGAVLTIGSKTKSVQHQLKPGAVVTITITVKRSAATVKIAYSKTSSVSLTGKGGRPADAAFDVGVPNPVAYSPVKFSDCIINGKGLAAFKPQAWASVTKSGKVDGKVSALSAGKNFTVSE
jgi:hypothetical protein